MPWKEREETILTLSVRGSHGGLVRPWVLSQWA